MLSISDNKGYLSNGHNSLNNLVYYESFLIFSDKWALIKFSLTIKPLYMIPTIIYLLLRRYRRTNPGKAKRLMMILRKASRLLFLFILLLLISLFAFAQHTRLEYSIKRKGSGIGTMSFSQFYSGSKTMFKVEKDPGRSSVSKWDYDLVNYLLKKAMSM